MSSNRKRRVLLVRPGYSTGLSRFAPLTTEPLELEYLAQAVNESGDDYCIWDGQVDASFTQQCRQYQPDIIAITGYYPARDKMLHYAEQGKALLPDSLVVVGGVHAELNQEDFQQTAISLVIHSGGYFTFREILGSPQNEWFEIAGINFQAEPGVWQENKKASFDPSTLPHPDRSYFHGHRQRFSYLYHGTTALVKTAFGCPFNCSFCYCRLLNDGLYQPRPVPDVVAEIAAIQCDTLWIVDDTFLLDVERLEAFARELSRQKIKRKLIVYGRANFICEQPQLLRLLKSMGVVEVIVGLESVNDEDLKGFHKQVSARQNRECVRLLQENGIGCTGLFIMDQKARARDFRVLDRWIKEVNLKTYTISVFSPFPGSPDFEKFGSHLLSRDCSKWDLLHVVLPLENMNKYHFLIRLYWLHLKMLWRNEHLFRYLMGWGRKT